MPLGSTRKIALPGLRDTMVIDTLHDIHTRKPIVFILIPIKIERKARLSQTEEIGTPLSERFGYAMAAHGIAITRMRK